MSEKREESHQLAQANPDDTVFNKIYQSGRGTTTSIRNIILCNTHTEPVTFSICIDINGETYDKTTALHWDQPIPALTTVNLEKNVYMNFANTGSIGIKQSIADAVVFLFNGQEKE